MSVYVLKQRLNDFRFHARYRHRKILIVPIALVVSLIVLTFLSCSIGAVSVSFKSAISFLFDSIGLDPIYAYSVVDSTVIGHIRIPRTIMALMVGTALAVSGASMQGMMRNPLADPGLLGITTGASLAAATMIVIGNQVLPDWLGEHKIYALPLAAFLGSLLVSFVIMRIGTVGSQTNIAVLLLAGLAINGLAGTGLGLLTYLADEQELRSLTFWNMGSLAHGSWLEIFILFPLIFISVFMLKKRSGELNGMLLGDEQAHYLGIHVQKVKQSIVVWVSLAVGASVALTGSIGFIGLMGPHLVRLAMGPDHRFLIPASALMGAVLLLSADLVARIIVQPGELPIGIVTSALGSPLFLWLLIKNRFGVMRL